MTTLRTADARSEATVAPIAAPPPEETGWSRRHLLDLDDFTSDEVELLMSTADAMKEVLGREVPRVPALRGTTIVTLFYENSTRTRASFELAGKVLGADVINVSASGSSVTKGESLVDTVKTLQAIGADVLVMRHHRSGAPYLAARHANCSVINAGDGLHAHPTQARLDQVNGERIARANPGALVMHPGPMNEGVEISHEVAHGLQSQVEEQVKNGVAVRMAAVWLITRTRSRSASRSAS